MLTVKDPKRFDVKSTFEQEIPALWRNSTYLRKRGCLDVNAVYGGKEAFKALVKRIDEAVEHEKHSEYEDYAQYKLQLNLPGGTCGLGVFIASTSSAR